MSKVTSKYQATIPKTIVDQYGIRPGDRIHWIASGHEIRVVPRDRRPPQMDVQERLRLFDGATRLQHRRDLQAKPKSHNDRGWNREDLYTRDRSR